MRWTDLAFLHWPVEPALVRPLVPQALELGVRDGSAWIGVTPFRMSRVRPRGLPPVPRLSQFLELNVRTYVSVDGKPGIWFFSLEVERFLAMFGARWTFGLPYHLATMAISRRPGGGFDYRSVRGHPETGDPRLDVSYTAIGPVAPAEPGSLEHWLTERYCLYSQLRGRLVRGEIHHAPWPLQPARAAVRENTMGAPWGLPLEGDPPLAHYARDLDVVAWSPRLTSRP